MKSKDIFVIMPFSSTKSCNQTEWDEIYFNVFQPAIEECGYNCERAMSQTGSLIKSIVGKLRNARIVLADITDQNPNVFYELGVRHSLSKRTIIIAQHTEDIPSDLKGYWSIIYGTSPGKVAQFKKDIKRIITQIEERPEESDNPVSDYLDYEHICISNFLIKENIKKIGALFTELSANINTLNEIKKSENYKEYISYDCLNLLLNSLYIDIGTVMLKECYELRHNLMSIKFGHRLQPEFIDMNIRIANDVLRNVLSIRNKLALGQYDEPDQVSTVIWEPKPPVRELELVNSNNINATGTNVTAYSRLVGLSDIDIDELKENFKKLDEELKKDQKHKNTHT
ncbi:MAG: hypothetical protein E4G94_02280 [ANME-2 cluster archaeon]|nr:MAG: hypothetical protein E4G94_02280 [ANME-2 cluster archaeon]